MAELVRQDQDARNESRRIRDFLAQDDSQRKSPAATLAALRARLGELDAARARMRQALRSGFPAYEQLVHPQPIALQGLQAMLGPADALVNIQPTRGAVYVWVLGKTGAPAFHRAQIDEGEVRVLAQRMRRTLDFGTFSGSPPPFDSAAS